MKGLNRYTIKLMGQMNGFYKIQVFDNGIMIREERDFRDIKAATKRIEEIKEEGRNAAAPGVDDARPVKTTN